jgi:hypothetical protein
MTEIAQRVCIERAAAALFAVPDFITDLDASQIRTAKIRAGKVAAVQFAVSHGAVRNLRVVAT